MQNQALCALIFLYRHILKIELGQFNDLIFAKRPQKIPVVFPREEVKSILVQLDGVQWVMGQILYGAGLRLMECLRLRIKELSCRSLRMILPKGSMKY